MRTPKLTLLTLAAITQVVFAAAADHKPLPAFPGAEGFGAMTQGGRGGRVIEVTNLNADGPGSLLAALKAKGPRIVVFRVGGVIQTARDLEINEPFITVAGQSAPGDGICIRGAALRVHTHDVVLRYLRVRVGDAPDGPDPDNRDALGIENITTPPYNIIIDHCSVSWAIDENMEVWYPCRNITIQWCLISEGLHESLHTRDGLPKDDPDRTKTVAHSMGLIVGPGPVPGVTKGLSIHHCLFAHNHDRNPLLSGDTEAEIINNVVYDWMWGAGTQLGNCNAKEFPLEQPSLCQVIGNFYQTGPSTRSSMGKGIRIQDCWGSSKSRVYLKGNIGPGRPQDEGDEWLIAYNEAGDGIKAFAPMLQSASPITTQPVLTARDLVLAQAGAVLPKRDSVDARVVQSVRDRSGRIINSQKEAGGWPDYQSAESLIDSDHDGIPDAWERAHGLEPNNPADSHRLAPSGYTWVEQYLNEAGQQP